MSAEGVDPTSCAALSKLSGSSSLSRTEDATTTDQKKHTRSDSDSEGKIGDVRVRGKVSQLQLESQCSVSAGVDGWISLSNLPRLPPFDDSTDLGARRNDAMGDDDVSVAIRLQNRV